MAVYQFYPSRRRRNIFSGMSMNMILIFINVVFFIVVFPLILMEVIDIQYVALVPANILQGAFLWTILTSMFMHGGIFHIFANMFSMFFVGGLVEKIIGPKRYLWFYLASGIFASLFFVLLAWIFKVDLNAAAVGASGALFALVGFLMIITPNLTVYVMAIIPMKMKYAGVGLLVVLWLISLGAGINIGNTAHLGGLIAGVGYGLYLKFKFPRKTEMLKRRFA